MISLFTCSKCKTAFSVSDEDPSRDLLKKTMRCPVEGCTGKLRLSSRTNIKLGFETIKISAVELYQATLGAGLPKEKKCSPAAMKKLLTGAKIVAVHLEEAPSAERSLLLSLTVIKGSTRGLGRAKVIHLASSTKGATIYKVTDYGTRRTRGSTSSHRAQTRSASSSRGRQ